MKKFFLIFLTITLISFSIEHSLYAQNEQSQYSIELQQTLQNRTESEKKIATDIYCKLFKFEKDLKDGKSIFESSKVFDEKYFRLDEQKRIFVNIILSTKSITESNTVKQRILELNGKIKSIDSGHNGFVEIKCWIPIDKIKLLSNQSLINTIITPPPPQFWTITTEGDAQLKATDVRNNFNVNGTGYKIGVISDGAKSYGIVPPEELPNITILSAGNIDGDEGTAMLEIVHDIAPGADLYFYGIAPTDDYLIFKLAIETLTDSGCNIIVDDLGFFDEPYFSDATDLGMAIRSFINIGGVYVAACGNGANSTLNELSNFSNSWHQFSTGNDYIDVTFNENASLNLQWKDDWGIPATDLDLYVYNQQDTLITKSDFTQSISFPPYEWVNLNAGSYRIKIKTINGVNGIEFKLVTNQYNEIPNNKSNQIFGHSAYPGVISVAAYQAEDESVVSDYSSRGPATMFSSADFQWTNQLVPTITATANVQTYINVYGLWGNALFSGTSAAAPHIAGLAALYFQKLNSLDHLNKTNLDFINDLKNSADDIGNFIGGEWYKESGNGKANILDAINQAGLTVSTPVITPVSGSYYQSVTCTLNCPTSGANIKYTIDNSYPSPTNGTDYNNQPFTLSTIGSITVIAQAFKDGMISSGFALNTYNITNLVAPVVDHASGEYFTGTIVNVAYPYLNNIRLYYQKRTDGSEPPSPESQNGGTELIDNPGRYFIQQETANIKFQIVDVSNYPTLVWSPYVYVQYIGIPSLRVAQVDDEISESFGKWYKWEDNNHWAAHPDETIIRPTSTSDWFIKSSQEFKDPDVFRKYNVWSNNLGDNYFVNHAKIPIGPNTSSVLAHFKQSYNVTVTNKLENSFSVNQGSFVFKNPWIVDDNSDSKGPRNRGAGTTEIPLLPYSINFSISPNITNSSIHKGVFLNQGITPQGQWQPPYYSVKVDAMQDIYLSQTGKTHRFYFQNWGGTNVNFQNSNALETPVVFSLAGATVQANLKGTQLSNNVNAFANNSQRKLIKTPDGIMHLTYESMGRIWYETSTDNLHSC